MITVERKVGLDFRKGVWTVGKSFLELFLNILREFLSAGLSMCLFRSLEAERSTKWKPFMLDKKKKNKQKKQKTNK